MAEHSFREVMYEVNRLCTTISNCDQNCPLGNMGCCGNLGTHCSDPLQVERIENTVMAWAAEHPEPVYPTWEEWLNSMGLTKHDTGQFCVHTPNQCSYEVKGVDILNEAAYKPIPADIAQKLGLEPKEVER